MGRRYMQPTVCDSRVQHCSIYIRAESTNRIFLVHKIVFLVDPRAIHLS